MTFWDAVQSLLCKGMIMPDTFLHCLGAWGLILAVLLALVSLKRSLKDSTSKFSALTAIVSLSLFANMWLCYLATIFITATIVTRLSFLEKLAAIIRGNEHYFKYLRHASLPSEQANIDDQAGLNQESGDEISASQLSSVQKKILNTLWNKQVDLFPDLSQVWTFTINAMSPEYESFKSGIQNLQELGLVAITDFEQYHLTHKGYVFCANNHDSLGDEQWWPEHVANKENLRKVLGKFRS